MFRIADSPEDRLKAFIVRGIVFVEEQGVRYDEEIDGLEGESVHVLAEWEGEPVAAARLRFPEGWAKLERIAVRRAWRGRGLGHGLVEFLLAEARRRGHRRFRLHAQAHLTGYYARHGFVVAGDRFDEAGIPHHLMLREDH